MSTATVTDGQTTVNFEVTRFVNDGHRIKWLYKITDEAGQLLSTGTDLGTPSFAQEEFALQSLLSFAAAAAESHRNGGTDHGFSTEAVEAFAQLEDEISLAIIDTEYN